MDLKGTAELIKSLLMVSTKARAAVNNALTFAGGKVRTVAQSYCPISPTQAQNFRLRKTKKKVQRKATATTRAKPGGLRRSIDFEVNKPAMTASIFVASNSEGGKYAKKIHDQRGISWNNLGPGSIAANKSGSVGEKFIERAIADKKEEVRSYMEAKLRKVGL